MLGWGCWQSVKAILESHPKEHTLKGTGLETRADPSYTCVFNPKVVFQFLFCGRWIVLLSCTSVTQTKAMWLWECRAMIWEWGVIIQQEEGPGWVFRNQQDLTSIIIASAVKKMVKLCAYKTKFCKLLQKIELGLNYEVVSAVVWSPWIWMRLITLSRNFHRVFHVP